jgi:hypothetical protein
MNRTIFAPFALAALGAVAISSAAAQVAGTYSGTTANGNAVSFTVATDSGTGDLAVTGASVDFSDLCTGGSTLNSGWGYGLTQDIKRMKVTNTTATPYFTIKFNLVFAADGQSATGMVSSIGPTLAPVGPKPRKALFCKSASQSMNVTLQSGDVPGFKPPAMGAVWLGLHN